MHSDVVSRLTALDHAPVQVATHRTPWRQAIEAALRAGGGRRLRSRLAQAQALLDQARAHLAAVEAALRRVGEGTYGRCRGCGGPIAPERLEARPEAEQCIRCAARRR
jgi:hypothetical protein